MESGVAPRGRYTFRPARTPAVHILVVMRHISCVVSRIALNKIRSEGFNFNIDDAMDDVCVVLHALNTGVV